MTHKANTRMVEGAGGEPLELDPTDGNPLLSRAVVTALVAAILALAVSFGVDLSDSQQAAITAVAVAAAPIVLGVWARRKVWSGKTVGEVVDRQLDQATRP
jgi:hypothetical protein